MDKNMTVEQWLGEENTLGIDIWKKKYQRNDETFYDWVMRVSGGNLDVAELIVAKKFLPGGRILSNRGITDSKVTYSNCYVIAPPEDNLESIYDCRKKLARTYSYGGGCGTDLSKLSPAGAVVRNQARHTSGAVSFMEGFSQTTEEIGQNGRRGALMLSLSCDHPDLEEFIDVKTKDGAVTKANISVRVTDAFMQAVEDDAGWVMSFTRPETGETITKTASARYLFDKLCKNNWDWAEPGILFWDSIQEWNLLSNNDEFEYVGVNPCAEEPLPAGGSCLLGSINLAEFVNPDTTFDFKSFKDTVMVAVEALNDILDEGMELHPLEEQRNSVRDWRQIGLGIMGLADALIKMEITYGSDEAIEFCDSLAKFMADEALFASAALARDHGPYSKYDPQVMDAPFFVCHASNQTSEWVAAYGLRNSQLLTIAPTGTLSTMLGISGGIEPIFANSYTRKTESLHGGDVYYKVYTPIVDRYMKKHGLTEEEDLPEWFVTSANISPSNRVKMQAAWQYSIDASISSTVNLPYSATVEDVQEVYMEAWRNGLKGITVFRDGCQRTGILTTSDKAEADEITETPTLKRGDIVECSEDLVGFKRKLTTGCGSLHVMGFFDPVNGEMQEVYLAKGSTGGCANFMTGLSRMISLLCRAGVSVYDIKDQLDSTGACPSYAARTATKHDTSKGSCCPMAIGNALISMYEEMQEQLDDNWEADAERAVIEHEENTRSDENKPTGPKCPECGEPLVAEGGCFTCRNCPYTKCS